MFGASLYGMKFVEQQFFPSSDRNELLVDFTLPQNASIAETKAQMDRFEAKLAGDPDIDHWSSYVGAERRAVHSLFRPSAVEPQLRPDRHCHQEHRSPRAPQGQDQGPGPAGICRHWTCTSTCWSVGPPAGRPVQYRLSGPDVQKVRELAQKLAAARR